MKSVILLCAILASIQCRPQPQLDFLTRTVPRILKYNFDNFLRGFSFDVETSDGFQHEARGELKSETGRKEDEGIEVEGSYMYTGDNGNLYRVDYTAGKDGFRPAGKHLVPSAGVKKLGLGELCLASLSGCGSG